MHAHRYITKKTKCNEKTCRFMRTCESLNRRGSRVQDYAIRLQTSFKNCWRCIHIKIKHFILLFCFLNFDSGYSHSGISTCPNLAADWNKKKSEGAICKHNSLLYSKEHRHQQISITIQENRSSIRELKDIIWIIAIYRMCCL